MRCHILIAALVCNIAASAAADEEPEDVSMVQLLASPAKFDRKFIRVSGFLRLEFEGEALYLHREDYKQGLTKNSIAVYQTEAMDEKKLNNRYVLIEGIFDAKEKGHLGLASGTIRNITRAITLRR